MPSLSKLTTVKICQPKIKNPRQVSQTGIKIEWYVNSCCVAESSGYSFNNNFPPVKDGDIVSQEDDLDNDNKNCTRAKQLKNAAGDDFSSKEGWTKYTIMPPCAKEDEKKPDQEAPGPDGSLNGTQAIGVGASGVAVVGATVMLGVAAAKRQRNKLAMQQAAENLSESMQKKREKAAAKLAELKAKEELTKVVAKVSKALGVLTVVAFLVLLSDEASAASVLSGDDPLVALLRKAKQDDAIPEPLLTMIANDERLREIAEDAARSGNLSAAQTAANNHAAQIISENLHKDKITYEEIETLLIASQGLESVTSLKPTVEKLQAASKQLAAGTTEVEGETATSGSIREESGVSRGAPAKLPGASANVQRLWDAITGKGPEGIPIDDKFAQKFQAQFGNEFYEAKLVFCQLINDG